MAKDLRSKTINQIMYITIGCVIAVLILFIMLYMVFSRKNNTEKIDLQIGDSQNQSETALEEASTSIGKKVNESGEYEEIEEQSVQVETANETESDEQVAQTQNQQQSNQTTNEADIVDVVDTTNENDSAESQETPKDPTFTMPVDGEIVKQYGKEKLIYSDTLKEWTTHLGIDIKADKTTIVKSSADGCVKSIKNDPRYGLTIVIEHENGFTSVYSNLLTAEFVVVGENVKSGQTIGTVGNSATFEILDDPHLHFEILKDGNSVDPQMYIK